MAEIISIFLIFIIGMYASYRYGFIKALREYNAYLIDSYKKGDES